MKTSGFRNLAVAICFLAAGGLAAISIMYPAFWSAIEWLFIGIVLVVAGIWWWASRKHRAPGPPPVRRLTHEARRDLRRDLLVALGIGLASAVGMVAAIKVASNLLGKEIPFWLATLCAVVWVGVTLAVAAPFIGRVTHVLSSQMELSGEGDEEAQDEA